MLSIKQLLSGIGSRVNQSLAKPSSIRTIAINSNLINNNNNSIKLAPRKELNRLQKCNIYSESILMIEKLDVMQNYKNKQFGPDKLRYLERVKSLVDSGKFDMVLRDDLINMIGLAENEEHIELIEKIIQARYQTHPESEERGWGTALMRLYYKHNLVDRALRSMTQTDKFGNFFSQVSSYRILMTMLYNAGRYEEVAKIFDLFSETKPGFQRENPEYFTNQRNRMKNIVLASMAKLNTPEALKIAQSLDIDDKSARSTMFIAYLALNQNEPTLALDYISRSEKANHIAIRCLKINAYIKIKRFEDVLIMIHRSLDYGSRGKNVILQETCDLIKERENEIEDADVKKELLTAIVELTNNGVVGEEKLSDYVFKEFTMLKRTPDGMDQREMRH